jgi:hypothetical protein
MNQPISPHPHDPHGRRMVDRDEEHLRLLGNYHLIVAGINAVALILFVVLPLLIGPSYYAVLGVTVHGSAADMQQRLLAGLLLGGLMTLIYALNGLSLKNKRHRISSMILSAVECLNLPLGMILGISAILVLRRESVKALFASQAQPQPQPRPLSNE